MVRGVPAIVSPRTGIAELISLHGGGLIAQPAARAMADVLIDLNANREKLAELSVQAQQTAEQLTFSHAGALLRNEFLRL